jgi:threonyl-tRNA synthetase
MSGEKAEEGSAKTHMDYAYDLDLVIKPESHVPILGREFGYYSGAGIPLFALGGGIYRTVLSYILLKFHALRGYYIVETPILASANLFELSGHLNFYRKNMFLLDIEGHKYAIKPMNCPYHILIFMHEVARYRNKVPLPFKIFELGRVHRYEPSGSLYGLLRVRGFTQDDAHIITPEKNIEAVIISLFNELKEIYEALYYLPIEGESIRLRLSFSDPKLIGKEFMGDPEEWRVAEESLYKMAEWLKKKYDINYFVEKGEAAFYGPKMDFIMNIKEAGIEKEWQLGTIQFDFNLPRRFKLHELVREVYGDINVYIIHRAFQGSLERFLGIYLEYSKGRLPFPLTPIQVLVIGIMTGRDEVDEYIKNKVNYIASELLNKGLRVSIMITEKTRLSGDIRRIETSVKPPIEIFVGEREVKGSFLSCRIYNYTKRRLENLKIENTNDSDAISELLSIVEKFESNVKKLIGECPRIPTNFSYMI